MMPKTILGMTLAAAVSAACGGDASPTQGKLLTPETGRTRMTLAPALDVSSIVDPALLDRIVIDEVVVNVDDVRLLGADPRLPTGGLRLLAGQRHLSTLEDSQSFPLPAGLGLDDLALFVHLQPSAALDGASVVVRARLYATARDASIHSFRGLSSEPDPDGSPATDPNAEPDPDGSPATPDPNKEPDPDGSPATTDPDKEPDPDGSPARGDGKKGGGDVCEPDPDGSPAIHRCKAVRRFAMTEGAYVPFELRGSDVVDLLVSLDAHHPFDVVLGVPAARWLTPTPIADLEQALVDTAVGTEEVKGDDARREAVQVPASSGSDTGMTAHESNTGGDGDSMQQQGRDDEYRLFGGGDADPGSIRKH